MKLIPLLLLLCSTLTASAVGAQELGLGGKSGKGRIQSFGDSVRYDHIPAPLSDSAIMCQPYFDLAIPEDIKNSVLWMFCDSIKYVVSANLSSQLSTDIVYFTYYGAMTVENYFLFKRVYTARDWHTPFAVLWQRKVMWSRE